MQVVRTICSSTANTSTVTLIFLHYFNNNDATIRCQFYDQRRRKLYHTLLGHGGQGGETSSRMDQRPLQKSVGRIFPVTQDSQNSAKYK